MEKQDLIRDGRINVENDPLLSDKKRSLFSSNNIINVYRIISSYDEDVRSLIDHCHIDRNCKFLVTRLLKKRYKTIDNVSEMLLKNLEIYGNKKYSSRIKEKWRVKDNLLKGNITVKYARVISLVLAKDIEDSIDIFNRILLKSRILRMNNKEIKIPIKFNELNNELAYLAGVIAGDGHIERDLEEMKLVDGHRDTTLKKYSYHHLKDIDKIIQRNFHYKGDIEKVKGNYFVFRYSSTLICRIMNFIYEIPRGNKSRKINVPKILKNADKEALFWRGIFDADGSVRPKNKAIGWATTSKDIYASFLHFCKDKNIVLFHKKKEEQYRVLVAEESIPNFARVIGISHPRKQKNLIRYLKKGASYKVPKCKKPNKKLEKIIEYLRPYKESVYLRLTQRREPITKREVKQRINFIKNVIAQKIVEVKRPRKNNHYYICSKNLIREINEHFEFEPLWNGFSEEEISRLKERWDRYG